MGQYENVTNAASKLLSDSQYHVAAGFGQDALNSFFKAHWDSESKTSASVYKGGGKVDEIGITYTYDIQTPALLQLSPLPSEAWGKIYQSWLDSIPEVARLPKPAETVAKVGDSADTTPPNVQVEVDKIHLTATTKSGISVALDLKIVVTGAIVLIHDGDTTKLRITPVAAKISDIPAVKTQLLAALEAQNISGGDGDELKAFLIDVINYLLANKISGFVKEFPLPLPTDLIADIQLGDLSLQILENHVVVLANIKTDDTPILADRLLLDTTRDWHDIELAAARIRQAPAAQIVHDVMHTIVKAADVGEWPARGLFVIFHERLFDTLSQSRLTFTQSGSGSKSALGFTIRWNWSIGFANPKAKINGDQLQLGADFKGGAGGSVSYHTHCGDPSVGLSVKASATPALTSQFGFKGDDFWVNAAPGLFTVKWDTSLPWPFNQIVSFLLDALSDVAIVVVNLFHANWTIKLLSIPKQVPKTTIAITPKFDPKIVHYQDEQALVLLADVTFSA